MAEKKQHTIVSAETGKPVAAKAKTVQAADPSSNSNPKSLRIVAWVLWILAFACEVIAILAYVDKIHITFLPTLTAIIILLVLDFALVVAGAQFWKKANHIDPVSEANKLKFWLWNNMGVIVCCFAFIPFIIIALTDKNADPKTKKVASIVAAVALVLGVGLSYDWNPVSEEGLEQATQTLANTQVYWTQYGKKYHTHEDCQYLNRTDVLTAGSIDDAVAAGRSTICSACAKKDNLTVGENGAVTGTVKAAEEVVEAVTEEPAA